MFMIGIFVISVKLHYICLSVGNLFANMLEDFVKNDCEMC